MSVKKIVVLGPESTGKSTLCSQLAAHYHTTWVPEYAREFLEKKGTQYTCDDLLLIAKGQLNSEDEILDEVSVSRFQVSGSQQSAISSRQNAEGSEQKVDCDITHRTSNILHPTSHFPHVFIDTDMYVMKVWSEFVFNNCNTWILNQIANRSYDGYLLCDVDLPWEKDALREYPDLKVREKLYHFYKEHLTSQQTPWCEINGNYEERLQKAIKFVNYLK